MEKWNYLLTNEENLVVLIHDLYHDAQETSFEVILSSCPLPKNTLRCTIDRLQYDFGYITHDYIFNPLTIKIYILTNDGKNLYDSICKQQPIQT